MIATMREFAAEGANLETVITSFEEEMLANLKSIEFPLLGTLNMVKMNISEMETSEM